MTSKKYFINNNGIVSVATIDLTTARNSLAPAVYACKYDTNRGFYLTLQEERFSLPIKIFGNNDERADRVLKSYNARDKGTGVLLVGEKGSGKTVLAKTICNKAIAEGVPVVTVAENFSGTSFDQFIDSLGNCVLFFDEFAKTYGKEQHRLLSLFDGTSQSKRITILTENDIYSIQEHMKNRPGRFLYRYEYEGVGQDVIEELAAYYGVPEAVTAEIVKYSKKVRTFTMDILYSIIEEYQTFGTTDIVGMVSYLNIDSLSARQFKVELLEAVEEETGNPVKFELNTELISHLDNFTVRVTPIDTKGGTEVGAYADIDDDEAGTEPVKLEDKSFCLYDDDVLQRTTDLMIIARKGFIFKLRYKEQEIAAYRYLI